MKSRAFVIIGLAFLVLALGTSSIYARPVSSNDGVAGAQVFKAKLGTNWAQADLDGDNLPDLAEGQQLGHDASGYLYRVSLELSRDANPVSFTFTDLDAMNLRVEAVDVDGDSDLDLVISCLPFGHKIGVWINNGKGKFERQAADRYPNAFSVHTLQAFHWNGLDSSAIDNGSRDSLVLTGRTSLEIIRPAAASVPELESTTGSRGSTPSSRLRAPPQQV